MQFSIDNEGNIKINNKLLMYDVFEDKYSSVDKLLPGEKLFFYRMKRIVLTNEVKKEIAINFKEMLQNQMKAVSEQNYKDKADLLGFYQTKITEIQKVIDQYERD
jgi:hypothetical protein